MKNNLEEKIKEVEREFDEEFRYEIESDHEYYNSSSKLHKQFYQSFIRQIVSECLEYLDMEEKDCRVYIYDSDGNRIGERKAGEEYQATMNGFFQAISILKAKIAKIKK